MADLGDQPSIARLLWRGATRRCPACGSGRLFRRWFQMATTCPRCGLRFERIEGHWIGSLGLNTIVSFGAILAALIGGVVATFPDVAIGPVIGLNVAVAIIVPVAFYPVSRTLWTGIDIAMRPLEAFEVDWTMLEPSTRRPPVEET